MNKWIELSKSVCRFTTDGGKILATEEIQKKWWNVIESRYNEKQRYYHTMNHINELLGLHDRFKLKLKSSETVLLSIWFHDIIYDPTRHDNEEQSALVFNQFSEQVHLNTDFSQKVYNFIMATKNHTKTPRDIDPDLNYFLDMDLSILGVDEKVYDKYAENIRKEYIHIDEQSYRTGRSKILQSFVSEGYEKLFRTSEFQNEFGSKSIENLKREINSLTN
ncbi:hypothetical protein CYY_004134 [Polysphondylium violaceum]|uniref:Metal-dependent HD superfamily phosphohydrolase n=1 Tax=Polysphondylium violaceum TaxID=133409 RepID=A0A8J4UT81_9MYCE|nr:hypothetical protein CYY_004134 [Polysphondylium violaceum]